MLKSVVRVAVVVASLGFAGVVGAVPVSYTDVVDPDDLFVTNNKVNSPYAFVHDILDDGFNPLTDVLTSVSLTLRFRDDSDHQPESVTVTLDNTGQGIFPITSGASALSPSVAVLQLAQSLVQNDGLLNVVLTRDVGDYWFMDSTLVATGERRIGGDSPGDVRIPEPGVGFLAGLALVAAGLAGRRKTV